MNHLDVRLRLERPDGAVVVAIRTADEGTFVQISRTRGPETLRIGLKVEELDAMVAALVEARRLLLGHPKHAAKGSTDPMLKGKS